MPQATEGRVVSLTARQHIVDYSVPLQATEEMDDRETLGKRDLEREMWTAGFS